ncbi:MAG TPA: hypothetical protein VFZ91_07455 [Allosphingosinicella sp.]
MTRTVIGLVIVALTLSAGSCPPKELPFVEVPIPGPPTLVRSGDAIRWEGESDYYVTRHAPGPGIYDNPFSWDIVISRVPGGLEVTGDNQAWTRANVDSPSEPSAPTFAYDFGGPPGEDDTNDNTRSRIYFSPPRSPSQIDHGRRWAMTIVDRGDPPSANAPGRNVGFVFVAPGRCEIELFEANDSAPEPGATITLSLRAGPSCKRARLQGAAGVLLDETRPGVGGPIVGEVTRTVQNEPLSFLATAWDAYGRRVQGSAVVTPSPGP